MKAYVFGGSCLMSSFIPLAVSAQVDDSGIFIDHVWSGQSSGIRDSDSDLPPKLVPIKMRELMI